MKLIQTYFRNATLIPLLMTIGALSVLALLTQSLQTIDLIVENRQSAGTFLTITFLALPQLIGVILPIAVFIASLYALNRMNLDSETVVAKAAGYSPWQIASPVLRVAVYALIVHLIINLLVQPFSQREMREAILDVRTDLASQLVRPGEFNSPAPGLTVYTSDVGQSGEMSDVLIYDSRDPVNKATYTAKNGAIKTVNGKAVLIMRNGNVQYGTAGYDEAEPSEIRIVGFDDYQFDLSEVMTLDPTLRLKTSDQYLHELLRNDRADYARQQFYESRLAEAHMRLSSPLYNVALVLIAIAFLVRGEFQRMGYGRRIAIAAAIGFFVRLVGFAVTSASEDDSALNAFQYAVPVLTIIVCIVYMNGRKQAKIMFKPKHLKEAIGP